MQIYQLGIKYNRAPLPFPGQKRRYIKQFCKVIERIPRVASVFDVFGGSSLLARVAKDTRPYFEVTTNDYCRMYRNRLDVIDDTNRVLRELWAAGAYRDNNKYSRYPLEIETRLKEIVATGKDQYTCRQQIFTKNSDGTIRTVCRTVPYDVELCKSWYHGLNVYNDFIEHDIYCDDVYILDPPYKHMGFTKRQKVYCSDETKCARDFCMECIENGRKIILFDETDSDLINLFMRVNRGKFDAFMFESNHGCYAKDMMITNIVE